MIRLIGILLSVVFVVFPVLAKDLETGIAPPDYLGTDVSGNKLNISDFKGKVVIISFWATWCAPCRKELPILDAIQKHVGEGELKVIAINFGEKRSLLKRLAEDLEGSLSVTFSYDAGKRIAKRYGVKSIPNMFMIDREGNLAYHHVGYGEQMLPELGRQIDALLRATYSDVMEGRPSSSGE